MLAVRIPTGIIEYTANVTARRPIIYRCCRCGREQVHLTEIKASSGGVYHAFSSATKKSATQERTRASALAALDAVDERTARKINVEHDYGYVGSVVNCGSCGLVQPWSTVPKPWRLAEHGVWTICTVLCAFLSLSLPLAIVELVRGEGNLITFALSLAFFVALIVLLAHRIVYDTKRRSVLDKMRASLFDPPIYVSKATQEQWNRGNTDRADVRRIINAAIAGQTRFCPNCGTKLSVGGYFCPNCGAPVHS